MFQYAIRRLLQGIPAIVGVTLIVFFLLHASGDPAQVLLGQDASLEQIERFRQSYGLDKPLYVQYGLFILHALQGNFGTSIALARPVSEIVLEYLPNSLILMMVSMLIALVTGIPAGVIAGVKRNSPFDYLLMGGAVLGQSMAQFWLGLMLVLVFTVKLHWLPTSGIGSGMTTLKHMILPALTLSASFLALTARLVRSGMLEVMSQDYIRTAYAKGLSQRLVLSRHALRNASIPLVVLIGLQIAYLIGSAVIVEIIFAWPGIGFLVYQAVLVRDYPIVLCIVTIVASIFVVINILADVLLAYVDPRIRFAGGEE